ncbi:hypothetical protein GCM10027277_08800 [Pseudoduganella ginsengisoli]|uniref:Phosphoglycerate mutase n=1 Tax=Pseudoduganella ginsengisoli TaxID=1462440 RepID=A0A6L6Q288_9BURK|nr:hypothetical protein [Pseudoduganella ginsengisoli]MTW03182.1 hypothetical protein [Pseudoduganella ginsengisoli]
MKQLTVAVPYSLIPSELAKDLTRAYTAPALAMLLGRHAKQTITVTEPEARLLPHEAWLTQRLAGAHTDHANHADQPPLAHAAMRALGVPAQQGFWFIVHPVHLALARTHMVLGDLRNLHLTDEDSRALFDAAKPYFDEVGKTLVFGDANTWFMRADDWRNMRCASPDAAIGENLADWMPDGEAKRPFRQLQNEIQMLWHAHPANAAREQRGLAPVNSFWMWGGAEGADSASAALPELAEAACLPWLSVLAAPALRAADAATVLARPQDTIAVLGAALPAGKEADWSAWLMHMQQLEQQWFAPLLEALRGGRLDVLELLLTSRTHAVTYTITKGSLRKFWRSPSLQGLTA